MTEIKKTNVELFSYGSAESSASEDEKRKIETGSFPFFLLIPLISGIIFAASAVYYGILPQSFENVSVSENLFFTEPISFSQFLSITADASSADLMFFALLIFSSCFVFRRMIVSLLLFFRTSQLLIPLAVTAFSPNERIIFNVFNILIPATSVICFFVGSCIFEAYFEKTKKLRSKKEKFSRFWRSGVCILSSLGASVFAKAAMTVILNLFVK